jgi:hypothetical protein
MKRTSFTIAAAALASLAATTVFSDPFETLLERGDLPPDARKTVMNVLPRAVLTRNIPAEKFSTTDAIMEYLFEHPVLTGTIVRGMGLGDFRVLEIGAGSFHVTEGKSIEAECRQIYHRRGLHLYSIAGQYYGSLFIHLAGEALLLARYRPLGDELVEVKADAALMVDNRFYGFLVTIFGPLFKRLVDKRFSYYMHIARRLAEALAKDPYGVYNRLLENGALNSQEQKEFQSFFPQKPSVRGSRY